MCNLIKIYVTYINRSSVCMRPRQPILFCLYFCFLRGVTFLSEYYVSCIVCRFLFSMESTLYVFLPDDVFLPRDHGLDFDIRLLLYDKSTSQSNYTHTNSYMTAWFRLYCQHRSAKAKSNRRTGRYYCNTLYRTVIVLVATWYLLSVRF